MRQNTKLRLANRVNKASIRTFEKKVRTFVEEKKFNEAVQAYQKFTSLIDRAAKKNIVHNNNAGRKKSRLNNLLKTIEPKTAQAASE